MSKLFAIAGNLIFTALVLLAIVAVAVSVVAVGFAGFGVFSPAYNAAAAWFCMLFGGAFGAAVMAMLLSAVCAARERQAQPVAA